MNCCTGAYNPGVAKFQYAVTAAISIWQVGVPGKERNIPSRGTDILRNSQFFLCNNVNISSKMVLSKL